MAPLLDSHGSSHSNLNHATASPSQLLYSAPYERPQPRPPKTPAHAAQVRVRNRRREWLSRHPSYFRSLEHELADPVLYDTLIRRFQSHEEREKEGRAKGFGRVLEVDLLRGEARLSKLSDDTPRGGDGKIREDSGGSSLGPGVNSMDSQTPQPSRFRSLSGASQQLELSGAPAMEMNWEELEVLETNDLEKRSVPQTTEEGRSRWDEFLRLRFIAGRDDDFNYRLIDDDDEYDAIERREQEDAWFENEEPSWVGESDSDEEAELKGDDNKMGIERPLTGETGVQDF